MPLFRTGASTYCIQFQAGEISSGSLRDVSGWHSGFKDSAPEIYIRPDTPYGHGPHTFWFGQPWPLAPLMPDILRGISPLPSTGDEWRVFWMGPLDLDTAGPVAGSVDLTEADDTLSAATTLAITATVAVTEADDVASAAGTVDIVGSVAVIEANDTFAGAAALDILATAAITEGDDVPSAAGTIDIVGSLSAVEGDDAIAGAATVEIIAVAVITEGDDTIEASALMPIFYPRRGGIDDREDYECWLRQWRHDLRRIIDRSFLIAAGIIDPVTFESIPPPDYSPLTAAFIGEARALDMRRAGAFMAERRRTQEDDAMAVLLLAA